MDTLDKFDIAILNELQLDARLTNTELASRVGMHSMDTILDLLHARLQADDAKASREAAAQRPVQ